MFSQLYESLLNEIVEKVTIGANQTMKEIVLSALFITSTVNLIEVCLKVLKIPFAASFTENSFIKITACLLFINSKFMDLNIYAYVINAAWICISFFICSECHYLSSKISENEGKFLVSLSILFAATVAICLNTKMGKTDLYGIQILTLLLLCLMRKEKIYFLLIIILVLIFAEMIEVSDIHIKICFFMPLFFLATSNEYRRLNNECKWLNNVENWQVGWETKINTSWRFSLLLLSTKVIIYGVIDDQVKNSINLTLYGIFCLKILFK